MQSRFSEDLTTTRGGGYREAPSPGRAVFLDQHVEGDRRDIRRIYYFVAPLAKPDV